LGALRQEPALGKVTMGASRCAERLQSEAVSLVQGRIREWVAEPSDTEVDRRLADLFISGVPCLDGLMPQEEHVSSVAESSLKATMTVIVKSLKYDPGKSMEQLPGVLAGLITDLQKLGSEQARRNLVDNLVRSGMLDQIIKSIVRSTLIDTLKSSADALDPKLVQSLTSRATLDLVFADAEQMGRLRTMVAKGMLEPMLLQGASLDSPVVTAANNEVKREVSMQLVNSDHFGSAIIGFTVQQKIDAMGGFTRFFARVLYGENSLDWQKVRATPLGRTAEAYIRDAVLKPKFFQEPISQEEEAIRMAKAEEMVTAAVKNSATRQPASEAW
ncbi:MAG: hypothetical protein HUU37_11025, partial [Bdellovibrionales bacterium]|nr:hypothetical protein [Bdellovibrionales bacterium]